MTAKVIVRDRRQGSHDVQAFLGQEPTRARYVVDLRDVHIDMESGDEGLGVPAELQETRMRDPRRFAPTQVDIVFKRSSTAVQANLASTSGWTLSHLAVRGPQLRKDGSHGQRHIINNYLKDGWWDNDTHRYQRFPTPDWLNDLVRQYDPANGWPLEDEEV